jgi:tetratricopeptide (TPR) repeat protein
MRLALVLMLVALPARAEAPLGEKERTERARAHFEMGRAHFNLGEYEAAVREFEEGYRLRPQPLFLYNLGNAARRAGQKKKALEMFRRYLAERPDAPERREVLQRIDELQKELAAEPPPPSPPPLEPLPPEPPPPEPPPIQPSPEPIQPSPSPAQPEAPVPVVASRPSWRRDWLGATLCAVGGAALLYGAVDFGVEYPRYAAFGSAMTWGEHNAAFPAARDASPHLTADVILMPIGAALVVAGAIRYAVLARRR